MKESKGLEPTARKSHLDLSLVGVLRTWEDFLSAVSVVVEVALSVVVLVSDASSDLSLTTFRLQLTDRKMSF